MKEYDDRMKKLLSDPIVAALGEVSVAREAALKKQFDDKVRLITLEKNVSDCQLQEKVKDKELEVVKIPGTNNPADLLTTHLDAATMWKHVTDLGLHAAEGRANLAPKLSQSRETAST